MVTVCRILQHILKLLIVTPDKDGKDTEIKDINKLKNLAGYMMLWKMWSEIYVNTFAFIESYKLLFFIL